MGPKMAATMKPGGDAKACQGLLHVHILLSVLRQLLEPSRSCILGGYDFCAAGCTGESMGEMCRCAIKLLPSRFGDMSRMDLESEQKVFDASDRDTKPSLVLFPFHRGKKATLATFADNFCTQIHVAKRNGFVLFQNASLHLGKGIPIASKTSLPMELQELSK